MGTQNTYRAHTVSRYTDNIPNNIKQNDIKPNDIKRMT